MMALTGLRDVAMAMAMSTCEPDAAPLAVQDGLLGIAYVLKRQWYAPTHGG